MDRLYVTDLGRMPASIPAIWLDEARASCPCHTFILVLADGLKGWML